MSLARSIRLISKGRKDEGYAATGFSPGALLELASDASKNGVYTYQVHSVNGGISTKTVATEDVLQGNTVDDAYTAGGIACVWHPQSGDDMQYKLKAGGTTPVVIGTKVCSAGDGTIIPVADAAAPATAVAVGEALEALDITGGAIDTLIAVRVY